MNIRVFAREDQENNNDQDSRRDRGNQENHRDNQSPHLSSEITLRLEGRSSDTDELRTI